jgi:ABC-type uncharacterized transport system auxiliary subunit
MNKILIVAAFLSLVACSAQKTVPADTTVVKGVDTSVVEQGKPKKDTVVKTTTEETKVLRSQKGNSK